MEIQTQTAEAVPPKSTSGLSRQGMYHQDVIDLLAEVRKQGVTATRREGSDPKSNLWDGNFVVATFDNYKIASTRAMSIRRAGYVGVARGNQVFASMDSELDYSDHYKQNDGEAAGD